MVGPADTPYEDGLFLFELQLPPNFPNAAPKVHAIAYSPELNPLMSWDGNFCVSALKWDTMPKEEGKCIKTLLRGIQGKNYPILMMSLF